MIGAIIGDLAAWTWGNDHKAFYPKLISDKAELSEYGKMLMKASSLLMRNQNIEKEVYVQSLQPKVWLEKYTVIRSIAVGWMVNDMNEVSALCEKYALSVEKEDWYASHYLSLLITALRLGATKSQASEVYHVGKFRNFLKGDHWEQAGDYSVLGYLVRAWKTFVSSYDFGSAIHKAIHLPYDTNFNCILVGALADAMYGHERYIVKKKSGHGGLLDLSKWIGKDVEESYFNRRTFYPKNRADTNVERYHYRNVVNPFAFVKLESDEYQKILRAYEPSVNYPHGFYFDDGWIYLYRDSGILGRFDIEPVDDGWRIKKLQAPDDVPYWELLDSITKTIEHCECQSVEKLKDVSAAAGLFVCFHGEDECPKEMDEVMADFWHAERMFLETGQSLKRWMEEARLFKRENSGKLSKKEKTASESKFGIALYIDLLLSKWNQYTFKPFFCKYLEIQ